MFNNFPSGSFPFPKGRGITLIGMPGAGKSTVGKILAERLGWSFVDLDIVILEKEGIGHEQILASKGRDALLALENFYTLSLDFAGTVFSPGGSIVYSAEAMQKLRQETFIIYLYAPLKELCARIGDNQENSRGIVGFREKGLEGLYAERTPFFERYADYKFLGFDKDPQIAAMEMVKIYETIQHEQS